MKKRVAEILLELGCFHFRPQDPFTYASGLKGPVYCDNRLIISHVSHREEIVSYIVEQIKGMGSFELVAGMATAGIPYAAWVAAILKRPLIYVRSQSKTHGRENLVEGGWKKGDKGILLEDLVNQGKSSLQGLQGMNEAGIVPLGLICIVDYEMETARTEFSRKGWSLYSLTDFSTIIQTALEKKIITPRDFELLGKWQKNPQGDYLPTSPAV